VISFSRKGIPFKVDNFSNQTVFDFVFCFALELQDWVCEESVGRWRQRLLESSPHSGTLTLPNTRKMDRRKRSIGELVRPLKKFPHLGLRNRQHVPYLS
jgi:hypothetical protein